MRRKDKEHNRKPSPSGIKALSFRGFQPASISSSHAKRASSHSDTKHEVLLRSELWRMGLRFRKNVRTLPGKPDLVFPRARTVVFCDGDFWHGRNWRTLRMKLQKGTNAAYWLAKIKSNRKRDLRNTKLLKKAGWHVIRLWESDIKKDPSAAALYVKQAVNARRGF